MVIDFINKRKKLIGDILISAVLILVFVLNLLEYFEFKLQDFAYQKPTMSAPFIHVLGLDGDTLLAFEDEGRFYDWSRQKIADAINILNTYENEKPAVIGIDILYAGESGDPEADAALVKAAANGGNVVFVSLVHYGEELSGDLSIRKIVKDYETPYSALSKVAPYGLSNGNLDSSDGVVREAILKQPFNGGFLYSFPVEIYKKYMEHIGEESVQTDDFITKKNSAYITYYGKPGEYAGSEYKHKSFVNIFDDDFPPDFYADEIVLIGACSAGFNDAYFTPMSQDTQMFGVEIHANVVQMLIESNFKNYVPWKINFIVLLLFILLAAVIIQFIKDIRILLGIFAGLGVGYYFFALYIFEKSYITTLLYPLFSLVIIYIFQVVYGYILEALEKRKLKSAFKKYVDPKLVDKLIENGEANSNEVGVKKNIAVVFVDVRGFTPMTEALKDQPEIVVKILNEYLELTSSAVFNNDGSVDKFMGDATMALFNGFFQTDDYVFKAVKAAWDMVQGAVKVNASIKEKYNVDVGFGIGVHCGDAIVGNLGPSFRKDYTAIGDTVNTTSRLENNAKRSEILISKNVYDILKNRIEAVSIGAIPLKGKSIELEVFSIKNILI